MQFVLDEMTAMIRDSVRSFVADKVREQAMTWNEEGRQPTALLRELAALGLMGVAVPEALGGAGFDAMALVVVLEELARGDGGLATMVAEHNARGLVHLMAAGYADKAALKKLASGATLCCWAGPDNPDQLEDPALQTLATRQDDGDWTLSGTKPLVLLGGQASLAVVLATVPGTEGPTAFAVDLAGPGITRRSPGKLLGLSTCDAAALTFADAPVSDARRLGEVGGAGVHVARVQAWSRLAGAAIGCGVAGSALEAGVRYTLERSQFGKPIAHFQPIQWQTADSAVDLDTALLLTRRAAWAAARGKDFGRLAAMAACKAAMGAELVADRALQMHGGYGYTLDFPAERSFRDAHALRLLCGSVETNRIAVATL